MITQTEAAKRKARKHDRIVKDTRAKAAAAGVGYVNIETMTMTQIEKLASALEKVNYRSDIAGKDERGILFGLKLEERDLIVKSLRIAAAAEVGGTLNKLEQIELALKKRGLFIFEHIDGTVSINDR